VRGGERPVILLVAEAVTLAHFARIAALSKALDRSAYHVVVASDPGFAELEGPLGHAFHAIRSIAPADFARSLAHGRPLYDVETLTAYVEDDLRLIRQVSPDLIVGDFRLSLAVSAPLARVPHAAVVNAYWSPYADVEYPVPELPATRILGVPLAQRLFDAIRPLAFALHARPLDRVRRRYNLPALGTDLRTTYTFGDYTLYADVPELVPMRALPAHHRHIGPPLWSVETPLPGWWADVPGDRPVVTVTLGSSGPGELLPTVLDALAELPVAVMASTIRQRRPDRTPPNAFLTDYLPLAAATRRSALLICNGGSMSTYQALMSGIPVIGVGSNLDQLLNMHAVERLGAGIALRAGGLSAARLKDAIRRILEVPEYGVAARAAGDRFSRIDASERFRAFVSEIVPTSRGRHGPTGGDPGAGSVTAPP
jgi:UDP:flavonoid glycosyltransferase YjiC (YdhE family)